ncbi:MAG: hypothetical protein ABIK07_17845, partial [Planctomycetota bacterium]
MRRGKKMLAIFSTMVMSASIATADDRMFESKSPFDKVPPSKAANQYFSNQDDEAMSSEVGRTGSVTISQPKQNSAVRNQTPQYKPSDKAKLSQVPNYYKELFGQERPYRRLEEKTQAPVGKQSSLQQIGHAAPADTQNKYRFEEFNAEPSGKKNIVHAEFQQGDHQSTSGK